MESVPLDRAVRLVFANPVCALVTANQGGTFNAQTVSWITALGNHSTILLVLNAHRHTVRNLARSPWLTLSVGVEGMERDLEALGSCSGRDEAVESGGKLARLGIACCRCGGGADARAGTVAGSAAGSMGDIVGGAALWAGRAAVPTAADAAAAGTSAAGTSLGGAAAAVDATAAPLFSEPPRVRKKRRGQTEAASLEAAAAEARLPCLSASPAHLLCRVVTSLVPAGVAGEGGGDRTALSPAADCASAPGITGSSSFHSVQGHVVLQCEIEGAWVRPAYWLGGKVFAPPPGAPALLSFLGSQTWGRVAASTTA